MLPSGLLICVGMYFDVVFVKKCMFLLYADCQEVDKTNKCECTKDFKEDEDNDNLCIPEKRGRVFHLHLL